MPDLFADPLIAAYVLVVAGLLGLVMGSFINCWAWRSTHGESVLKGRSHCATCRHELGVRDLVPVFSWLASGRKCRYCGKLVSARYPITEIVCCIVFVALTARYGLTLETVEMLVFAGILLFLSLTDLDEFIIPNGCILAALGVRVVYMAASFALGTMTIDDILYYVASAFGVGIALVIVVLIADKVFGRDSMGGGDLKLYFVAALYFGWQQSLLLVIISCIIGILVAFLAPKRADETAGETTVADSKDECEGGATEDESESEAVVEVDSMAIAEGKSESELRADIEAKSEFEVTAEANTSSETRDESVMKRVIPFGPSIAAACIITALVGKQLIAWYMGLF